MKKHHEITRVEALSDAVLRGFGLTFGMLMLIWAAHNCWWNGEMGRRRRLALAGHT